MICEVVRKYFCCNTYILPPPPQNKTLKAYPCESITELLKSTTGRRGRSTTGDVVYSMPFGKFNEASVKNKVSRCLYTGRLVGLWYCLLSVLETIHTHTHTCMHGHTHTHTHTHRYYQCMKCSAATSCSCPSSLLTRHSQFWRSTLQYHS